MEYNKAMDERPATRGEMLEMFAALRTDMAAQTVELKADMAAQRGELKADMAAQRGELKADMAALKQEILDGVQEQIRDSQTEILKAFLPYQESNNLRMQ